MMPSLFDNGAIAQLVRQLNPQPPVMPGIFGDAMPPGGVGPTQGAMPAGMNQGGPHIPMHTGGIMDGAPDPGLMPPMGAPAPSQPHIPKANVSLFDRVANRMRGVMGLDNDPAEYNGVLSDEQIASTRPGLLEGIFGRTLGQGNADRTAKLDRLVGMQDIATKVGEQKRIKGERARIAEAFKPTPGESSDALNLRLRKMHAEFARVGDVEMASKLSEVIKSIQPDTPTAKNPQLPQIVRDIAGQDGKTYIEARGPNGELVWRTEQRKTPQTQSEINADKRFEATERNRILDDFRSDTTFYGAARAGYEVLKGALKDRNIATPFAVLDAYARVTNPQAAVRLGTMQLLNELGSAQDKWRRWMSMASKGLWPEDMMQEVAGTTRSIMSQHNDHFREQVSKAEQRAKVSNIDIKGMLSKELDLSLNGVPEKGAKPIAGVGVTAGDLKKRR